MVITMEVVVVSGVVLVGYNDDDRDNSGGDGSERVVMVVCMITMATVEVMVVR